MAIPGHDALGQSMEGGESAHTGRQICSDNIKRVGAVSAGTNYCFLGDLVVLRLLLLASCTKFELAFFLWCSGDTLAAQVYKLLLWSAGLPVCSTFFLLLFRPTPPPLAVGSTLS